MVYKIRKKNTRHRGHVTHGWGSMKKHRGKGNKGGCGNAGTGKRGDANKPSIWKNKKYFGKHGFKKKGMKIEINAINLDMLQSNVQNWLNEKKIAKEGESLKIDLAQIGYNKLLGRGNVNGKYEINVDYASAKAVEKIKAQGGQIITPEPEE